MYASILVSKGAVKKNEASLLGKCRWTSKLKSNFKEITSGVDLTVIEKFDTGKAFASASFCAKISSLLKNLFCGQ